MILLDTNVISELMKPDDKLNPSVKAWIEASAENTLSTTSLNLTESLIGLAAMPDGKRKDIARDVLKQVYAELFGSRVMPFDANAAQEYVALMRERQRAGRPIKRFDAQIAAIARTLGASLATGDRDFLHCGIDVINPWEYAGA
jgi:toxin FitB